MSALIPHIHANATGHVVLLILLVNALRQAWADWNA